MISAAALFYSAVLFPHLLSANLVERSIKINAKGLGEAKIIVAGKEPYSATIKSGENTLSVPSGVSVLIKGKISDKTGQETLFVIKLSSDKGAELDDPIPLEITERGSATITSSPTEAAIHWDQDDTGKLTKSVLNDKVGKHNLTLKKTGYKDWHDDVTLEADKGVLVFAELEKK